MRVRAEISLLKKRRSRGCAVLLFDVVVRLYILFEFPNERRLRLICMRKLISLLLIVVAFACKKQERALMSVAAPPPREEARNAQASGYVDVKKAADVKVAAPLDRMIIRNATISL